jgi:hypothetical protein
MGPTSGFDTPSRPLLSVRALKLVIADVGEPGKGLEAPETDNPPEMDETDEAPSGNTAEPGELNEL